MTTATPAVTPLARRRARRSKSKRSTGRPPLRGLLPLVALLVLWELVGDPSHPNFPPPSTWWNGISVVTQGQGLVEAVWQTALSFILGLLIATAAGAVIGGLVGASDLLDRMLGPTFEFFRATPASALVPIAVLLMGYTTNMKLAVVVFASWWPILLNTRLALRGIAPLLRDVRATLHLTKAEYARKILMPVAASGVFLGARIAAPVALVVTLLVEVITQINGLGGLISQAQQAYRSGAVFGLLILAGLVAITMNAAVALLESTVMRRFGPMSGVQ
jgi:ABC-type nitrate/sulfonate/bicarbonate transport system permease component